MGRLLCVAVMLAAILFTGKPALRGECSTGTPLFAAMTQSPELPGLADVFRLA
jgi:hypothetical protein